MKIIGLKYSQAAFLLGFTLNTVSFPESPLNAAFLPKSELPVRESASVPVAASLSEFSLNIRHQNVPFYSQFRDISIAKWKKLGCGVAGLAMLIEYQIGRPVSVMQLLFEGIAAGAFQNGVGWKHQALASLAENYGLNGRAYDLSTKNNRAALQELLGVLRDGPVLISIHHKFDPARTLGHLVAVTGFENDVFFYHDPEGPDQARVISTADFLKGWKKRFIAVR